MEEQEWMMRRKGGGRNKSRIERNGERKKIDRHIDRESEIEKVGREKRKGEGKGHETRKER